MVQQHFSRVMSALWHRNAIITSSSCVYCRSLWGVFDGTLRHRLASYWAILTFVPSISQGSCCDHLARSGSMLNWLARLIKLGMHDYYSLVGSIFVCARSIWSKLVSVAKYSEQYHCLVCFHVKDVTFVSSNWQSSSWFCCLFRRDLDYCNLPGSVLVKCDHWLRIRKSLTRVSLDHNYLTQCHQEGKLVTPASLYYWMAPQSCYNYYSSSLSPCPRF